MVIMGEPTVYLPFYRSTIQDTPARCRIRSTERWRKRSWLRGWPKSNKTIFIFLVNILLVYFYVIEIKLSVITSVPLKGYLIYAGCQRYLNYFFAPVGLFLKSKLRLFLTVDI